MKKVSVITILDNNNFGTYLQAFALCSTLEDLGYVPELVDYCRPHLRVLNAWIQMVKKTKNPFRVIVRSKYFLDRYFLLKKDRIIVAKYLSEKTCYSLEELKKTIGVADIYMTGSDQVWNSIYNNGVDEAYFLSYAPKWARKVSYGASIGMSIFSELEKEKVKSLLDDYELISLRESSSVKILKDIGIEENKIRVVLDPIFLLSKEKWSCKIPIRRLHKERYLLVYSVETKLQDALIDCVASTIAKKKDLKVVGVYYGNANNSIRCCSINHFLATPDMFLSLMYYADFVVVSSFHGTAFSINFNKDFYTIVPNRFKSRVEDLLSRMNLSQRLIESESQILNNDNFEIDWSKVSPLLEFEREKSLDFFQLI